MSICFVVHCCKTGKILSTGVCQDHMLESQPLEADQCIVKTTTHHQPMVSEVVDGVVETTHNHIILVVLHPDEQALREGDGQ